MKGKRRIISAVGIILLLLPVLVVSAGGVKDIDYEKWADPKLESLDDLSVESLRSRAYGTQITLVDWLGKSDSIIEKDEYQDFYSKDGSAVYNTYIAAYRSDGLRVYTRVDIPASEMPEEGYPVVIFVHGWVGEQDAPGYTFNYGPDSYYGDIIDTYVDAGYVVLMPGFRGHGTVHDVPADGIEFMTAFDNGSYTSPIFYAIDVLNLIDGLKSLEHNDWSVWGFDREDAVQLNLDSIHISGHSQGGDAVLTALAVSGENSNLKNSVKTGSLWSGCFPDRVTQLDTYGAMGASAEAFKAGTQDTFEWNGTAVGKDGSVNPNFIFGWPPDWIGTVNPEEWSWQADYFNNSVHDILKKKYSEMYTAFNEYVEDIDGLEFSMSVSESGKVEMEHDPKILAATNTMSTYLYPDYLKDEKIILHHSDQDYYSIPEWNRTLSRKVNEAGGNCIDFIYPENTHSLQVSAHEWYDSDGSASAGRSYALKRDITLFQGGKPEDITYP